MGSEIEAVSKATEEVARTAGKAIDASSGLGSFLKQIFGAALGEYGAQWRDTAQFRRAANLMKLQRKWEQLRADHQAGPGLRELPLKFSYALIEAASLEEDDELQDLFAKLLYNATDTRSHAESRQAFVSMLQGMSGLDVRVLFALAKAPDANPRIYPTRTVLTAKLPGDFVPLTTQEASGKLEEPPEAVMVSLNNLARLGCVAPAGVWDGAVSYGLVTFTALGQALVAACTVGEGGRPHPRTGPTGGDTSVGEGPLDLSV